MDRFVFALAIAGYAGMALAMVAAARGGRLPPRLWRAVVPVVLLHVVLVWAWRYEWEIVRATRNGWTAFVVFHAAALMAAASLWAAERPALLLARGAFLISTAGALGAVARRPEVAVYRVPVLLCALAGLGSMALDWFRSGSRRGGRRRNPAHPGDVEEGREVERMEKATFGAGCFWGVEERFRQVPGVVSTAVGYMGGALDRPTYRDVCTDRTGHAEVVQIDFDPARVSYRQLLDLFWSCHDPTTLDRQGPDVGTQYRSAIFFHSAAQQSEASESKAALGRSGRHRAPIVTEIVPAAEFWRAEDYHQKYLMKRGLGSCHL